MAPASHRFCLFLYALLSVAVSHTTVAQSANILCLLGTPSTGHHVWHKALLGALAERGHNLTVLTVDPVERRSSTSLSSSSSRLHFISMSSVYDTIYETRLTAPSRQSSIAAYLSRSVYGRIAGRYADASQVDGWLVESDGVRRLAAYPRDFRFDAVLHDSHEAHALLGFVDWFGRAPLVALSAAGEFGVMARLGGAPNYASYQPYVGAAYASSGEMTFIERTRNLSYYLFDWFYRSYVYMVNENRKARRLFGGAARSLESIERSTALVLLNVDFALDSAHLMAPNVIAVGGLQAQRTEFLDEKLQHWLDECQEGAIYIYLAANPFGAAESTVVQRHVLVKVFKVLKNVCFVWSTDEQHLDRLPANVVATDWMPQNAVLAHPNVKLHITHGGHFSVQEAAWHAVPQLVLTSDEKLPQPVRSVLAAGAAESLHRSIKSAQIIGAIRHILSNSSRHSLNAHLLSRRLRSNPLAPMQRAVGWIEATIGNGDADHLCLNNSHLYFWQEHIVDIALVAFLLAMAFVFILIKHCLLPIVQRSPVAPSPPSPPVIESSDVVRIKSD